MDLYEAAQIDGANRFKRVCHVTLPSLMPTAMILLIMQVGQMFGSNFELVYNLRTTTYGSHVISTLMFEYGLEDGQYDIKTALSLLQGVIALVLTMGANKVSEKLSSVSMW